MTKVLVIDDDVSVLMAVNAMLEHEGYHVTTAPDGAVGIALASTEVFDLVITDLVMPEKEGIETIMELRRRDPDLKIMAISGVDSSTDKRGFLDVAVKLGADDALRKPFTREELLEAVERCLAP